MLASPQTTQRNSLLNALPEDKSRKLSRYLKPVRMPRGEIIYEPGEPIEYVYFPENAILSTVTFFKDGASVETGIIGREGMSGINVALSETIASRETTVQTPGMGYQLNSDAFREVFEEGGAFQHAVLRYIFAYHEQVAQAGACGNHHAVNESLARWLLMCHDRTDGDDLQITQDFMAQMLGVHRPGVTHAAMSLKQQNLIDYSRGLISIVNRHGLERASCECYSSIRKIYDQYITLLDLQQLNKKLDAANVRFAQEMERWQQIQQASREGVGHLRKTVNEIAGWRKSQVICARCDSISIDNKRWMPADENTVRAMRQQNTTTVICPSCEDAFGEKPKAATPAKRKRDESKK